MSFFVSPFNSSLVTCDFYFPGNCGNPRHPTLPSTVPSLFSEGIRFVSSQKSQKSLFVVSKKRRSGRGLETCAMEVREILIKKIEKGCQATLVFASREGGVVRRAKEGGAVLMFIYVLFFGLDLVICCCLSVFFLSV